MPRLTDIAVVKIGKEQASDALKGLYAFRRTMPQKELSLKNRLRTTLVIGDASKSGSIKLPSESKGTFASWRSNLEREPRYDLVESQPLNKVKDTTKEDIRALMLEMKHKKWLEEVDARMRKLGFKA